MSFEEEILDTASMKLEPNSSTDDGFEGLGSLFGASTGNASSNYPFRDLEISFAILLNITGLSLALGWSGFCCILPICLTIILVLGNILKIKREEYFMKYGLEATRHPAFTIICIIAIFTFLVAIFVGMIVNYEVVTSN